MHFQTPSYQHRYGKEVTETLLRPLWICRSADPKLSLSRAAKLSAQRPSPASEPCFDAHVSLPLEGRGNYRTSCRAVSQRHPETRCTWIRPRMHGRATVFIINFICILSKWRSHTNSNAKKSKNQNLGNSELTQRLMKHHKWSISVVNRSVVFVCFINGGIPLGHVIRSLLQRSISPFQNVQYHHDATRTTRSFWMRKSYSQIRSKIPNRQELQKHIKNN